MRFLPFNSVFVILHLVCAMHNLTIDDTDPSIHYQGNWDADSYQMSRLDYGGAHTVSEDPSANATFTFVGVAVYYMSPLWPFQISVTIRLDSGSDEQVNLMDPSFINSPVSTDSAETVLSQSVWDASGLTNTTHQVFVYMGTNSKFVVVDGFNYTVLDADDVSTTSSVSLSFPAMAPSSSAVQTFSASSMPLSSFSPTAASLSTSNTSQNSPPTSTAADSSSTSDISPSSRVTHHNSTPLIAGTASGLFLFIAVMVAVWVRSKLHPKPHLSDFGPHTARFPA